MARGDPGLCNEQPRLFHRAMPLSGGISLASALPPGSLATLNPASYYAQQGTALLVKQLVAAGLAADDAAANAYIAGRTPPQQLAAYLRSKTPAALLQTLLFKLAALGRAGSGPVPDGHVLPIDPVAAIAAGQYLHVPIVVGNARDEAKLFPTFLPVYGTPSGRLVNDATWFNTQFSYNPDAAPQIAIQSWIPAVYLPVDTPVTGFNARTDYLNQRFFIAARNHIMPPLRQQQSELWYYQFDWDEQPVPWNDIYGAAHLFDIPFMFGNFGPSLFGQVAFSSANKPGRLALSAAMMASVAAFARSGDPNTPALGARWTPWPSVLHFDATKTSKAISLVP